MVTQSLSQVTFIEFLVAILLLSIVTSFIKTTIDHGVSGLHWVDTRHLLIITLVVIAAYLTYLYTVGNAVRQAIEVAAI